MTEPGASYRYAIHSCGHRCLLALRACLRHASFAGETSGPLIGPVKDPQRLNHPRIDAVRSGAGPILLACAAARSKHGTRVGSIMENGARTAYSSPRMPSGQGQA